MRAFSAADVIRRLNLKPHPEGGHFRETFRDPCVLENGRSASTAIYFLLARGERSHWHRIDAVETWHYYAGASLELAIANTGRTERVRLGADQHADHPVHRGRAGVGAQRGGLHGRDRAGRHPIGGGGAD